MSDIGQATSAGAFIEVRGRKYAFSKLTALDFGWLCNWLKKRLPDPREVAKESIRSLDPGPPPQAPRCPEGKQETWTPEIHQQYLIETNSYQEALRKYSRLRDQMDRQIDRIIDKMDNDLKADVMSSAGAMKELVTPEGTAVMLWLGCRKMDQTLKLEHFDFLWQDPRPGELERIQEEAGKIHALSEDAKDQLDVKNSLRGLAPGQSPPIHPEIQLRAAMESKTNRRKATG